MMLRERLRTFVDKGKRRKRLRAFFHVDKLRAPRHIR